jgi:fructose-1,6-bisphosphatase/inositol monophosphatase family enzyme
MYDEELAIALDAARRASQYLLQEYARFQVVPDAPANITTDADRGSQEIILNTIRQAFPADALCAEETTQTLQGVANTGAGSGSSIRSTARAASRARTASSR